jgi:hypothetical protein
MVPGPPSLRNRFQLSATLRLQSEQAADVATPLTATTRPHEQVADNLSANVKSTG